MAEICSNDKNVGFIFTSERTKACLFLLFLSIYSRHGSLIDNSTARILPDDVSVFIDCFVVQTKYWLSKRRDQFSKDEKRDGFHFLDNWISIRGFAVYQNASGLETKRKCGAKSFSSKSWSKVRFFFFLILKILFHLWTISKFRALFFSLTPIFSLYNSLGDATLKLYNEFHNVKWNF